MIDTHSHIYGPEFLEDVDQVISRAQESGIEKILLPNINLETIDPMLDLCEQYPGYLYPMMGLHPEDVKEDFQQVLDTMEHRLQQTSHPYIAVGEVGLDFYWDQTYRDEQLLAFDRQIQWAVKYHLPLMIHTRSAHRELVEALTPYKECGLQGVFHCFGGTLDEAIELLTFEGFALGIGGVLTFKKTTLSSVLEEIPLGRIVIETDSPYLAPVPYRGKRNESSFAVEVQKKLALIYKVSAEEVSECTNRNVKSIFRRLDNEY